MGSLRGNTYTVVRSNARRSPATGDSCDCAAPSRLRVDSSMSNNKGII
nr:TPA_asm: m114.5 sORF 4 [Murid betaherpesvirus 1]DBA07892.1 TPA_asm: m114.5 sORF 4 [Murid betaherpesvirus 1]